MTTVTAVTATVPKSTNHIWQGKGRVVSIDLQTGIVILAMATGACKGEVGGFNLDSVRFHIKRSEESNG